MDYSPHSLRLWERRYRGPGESVVEDTFERVARALFPEDRVLRSRLLEAMCGLELLPSGRILRGAGRGRSCLLSTFMVSLDGDGGLSSLAAEVRRISLHSGGVGVDLSRLDPARDGHRPAILEALERLESLAASLDLGPDRRPAIMALLPADHPEIVAFTRARYALELEHLNLSVLLPDGAMQAIESDGWLTLGSRGRVRGRIAARKLWRTIAAAALETGDPGLIFIDRVRRAHGLGYCEELLGTGSCGEQPLSAGGCSALASINLPRLVRSPFSPSARLDESRLEALTDIAVRALDEALDRSDFPTASAALEARAKRKIGVGITGLGSALALVGARYGGDTSVTLSARWARRLHAASVDTSTDLSRRKGPFPLFEASPYLAACRRAGLSGDQLRRVERHGLRNGALNSIAPSASISLLAANVSSGIEPIYRRRYRRRLFDTVYHLEEYSVGQMRELGMHDAPALVECGDLRSEDHVRVQAAIQREIDGAIAKTINLGPEATVDDVSRAFSEAHAHGCKGCTVFVARDERTVIR